jgi:hypothetical protein
MTWLRSFRSSFALSSAAAALSASLAVVFEGTAHADPSPQGPPEFGRAGDVAIDNIIGFGLGSDANPGVSGAFIGQSVSLISPIGFSYNRSNMGGENSQNKSFWIDPSVDVFVAPHVSIGAAGGIYYQRSTADRAGASTTLAWAVRPRVGYAFRLADHFSFWPRLSVGYRHDQTDFETGATAGYHAFTGALDLSFVYRPVHPLFFRVGPEVRVTYGKVDDTERTAIFPGEGLGVELGGSAALGLVF